MDPTIPAFVPHAPSMQLSRSNDGQSHASTSSLSVSSMPFVPSFPPPTNTNGKQWNSAEIPQDPVFQQQPYSQDFYPAYQNGGFVLPEMQYNAQPRGRSSVSHPHQPPQSHSGKSQNGNPQQRSHSVPNGPQNHHNHPVNGSAASRGRGSQRGRGRGGLSHQPNGHSSHTAPTSKPKPNIHLDSVDEFPALGGPSSSVKSAAAKSPVIEQSEDMLQDKQAEGTSPALSPAMEKSHSDTSSSQKASSPSASKKPVMSFARIVASTPAKDAPVSPQPSQSSQPAQPAAAPALSFARAAAPKPDSASTARSISGSSTSAASTPEDSLSSHSQSSSHSPRSPNSRTPSSNSNSNSDSIAAKGSSQTSTTNTMQSQQKTKGRRHSMQHPRPDNRNGFAPHYQQQQQQQGFGEGIPQYWNTMHPPPQQMPQDQQPQGLSAVQAEFLAANGLKLDNVAGDAEGAADDELPKSPALGQQDSAVSTAVGGIDSTDRRQPTIDADAEQVQNSSSNAKDAESPTTALSARRISVLHADAPAFVPHAMPVSPQAVGSAGQDPANSSAIDVEDEYAEAADVDVQVQSSKVEDAPLAESGASQEIDVTEHSTVPGAASSEDAVEDEGDSNPAPAPASASLDATPATQGTANADVSDTATAAVQSAEETADSQPAVADIPSTAATEEAAGGDDGSSIVEQAKEAIDNLSLQNVTETITDAATSAVEVVREKTDQAVQAVTEALPTSVTSESDQQKSTAEEEPVEKDQSEDQPQAIGSESVGTPIVEDAAAAAPAAEQDQPASEQQGDIEALVSPLPSISQAAPLPASENPATPEIIEDEAVETAIDMPDPAEDSGSEEASKLDQSTSSLPSEPASEEREEIAAAEVSRAEEGSAAVDDSAAQALPAAQEEAVQPVTSNDATSTTETESIVSAIAAQVTQAVESAVEAAKTTVEPAAEAVTAAVSSSQDSSSREDVQVSAQSSDIEVNADQVDASVGDKASPPFDQLSESSIDLSDIEERRFQRSSAPSPPLVADRETAQDPMDEPTDVDRSAYLPVAEESDVSDTSSISLGVTQDDDDTPSLHPSSISSESTVLASSYPSRGTAAIDSSPKRNGMTFGTSESAQQTPKAPKRKRGGKAAQPDRRDNDSDGSVAGRGSDDSSDDEMEPKKPSVDQAPSLTLSIFSGSILPRKQLLLSILASVGINFFLPFVNGVMLGFGEILARDWIGPLFGFTSARSPLNQAASTSSSPASASRFSTPSLGLRGTGYNGNASTQRGGAQDVPGHPAAKTAIETVAQGVIAAAES